MITYEQDSDVAQWGRHLFDIDPICSSGCINDTMQHDADTYHEQYFIDHNNSESTNVENDEIIANTLQEDFAQLAVIEASASSPTGEEPVQLPIFAQDWPSPSMLNYHPGHGDVQEEADDMEMPFSSCSSPGETSYDGEEYSYPMELSDEYVLDGEVGKILNQTVPVPHVPRINGEIPSIDEATSDHQRLLDRLQSYGLVELKVQGDGNCQFRAMSDQFYRTPEHHKFVRRQIVKQLKSHPEIYEGYVPMAYGDYLKRISKSGEWGDHVTLQAAADSYGVKIVVITSFKDTFCIEILPYDQKSKRGCAILPRAPIGTSTADYTPSLHFLICFKYLF
ncbi:OVARIAN TUMOR DOMAIN-containing deubiquitinating enzyme 10-like isoform X2 [Malania oleifera]|uniref:OVARIAN TUMOR DOMAIN-containing deubiquitinating enzyme 10-like isoform X2 n=1 Tax=Malania oleifera TaxID=397392 RepID=UPI0025AE1BDA|nr:OVARIAN TUMOR DOMAIN-containing deubiquitinating enzyme 10-like isoform X2 [Malania oleifera]